MMQTLVQGAHLMTHLSIEALTISTPEGELFAKQWIPPHTNRCTKLLHDSLGCVALWRDFP